MDSLRPETVEFMRSQGKRSGGTQCVAVERKSNGKLSKTFTEVDAKGAIKEVSQVPERSVAAKTAENHERHMNSGNEPILNAAANCAPGLFKPQGP